MEEAILDLEDDLIERDQTSLAAARCVVGPPMDVDVVAISLVGKGDVVMSSVEHGVIEVSSMDTEGVTLSSAENTR